MRRDVKRKASGIHVGKCVESVINKETNTFFGNLFGVILNMIPVCEYQYMKKNEQFRREEVTQR